MSLTISAPPPPATRLPKATARLPQPARAKLHALTMRHDAERDLCRGTAHRYTEAAERVRRLADQLEDLESERQQTGKMPLQFDGVKAEHAEALADMAQRQPAMDAADEAAAPLAAIMARVMGYLDRNRDADFAEIPAVTVKPTGRHSAQIEAARKAVEELQAEREAVRTARAADEDLRRGVDQVVGELVAAGRPMLGRVDSGYVDWPKMDAEVFYPSDIGRIAVRVPAALAQVAWLLPELVRESLLAEAITQRDAYGQAPGLPRDERAKVLATLEERILTAERSEEAVIMALEGVGFPVPRRPDADPRAVLGIDGPAPGEA